MYAAINRNISLLYFRYVIDIFASLPSEAHTLFLDAGPKPGQMGRFATGSASDIKIFCQNIQTRYNHESL